MWAELEGWGGGVFGKKGGGKVGADVESSGDCWLIQLLIKTLF